MANSLNKDEGFFEDLLRFFTNRWRWLERKVGQSFKFVAWVLQWSFVFLATVAVFWLIELIYTLNSWIFVPVIAAFIFIAFIGTKTKTGATILAFLTIIATVMLLATQLFPGLKSTASSQVSDADNAAFGNYIPATKMEESIIKAYKDKESKIQEKVEEANDRQDYFGAAQIMANYRAEGDSLHRFLDSLRNLKKGDGQPKVTVIPAQYPMGPYTQEKIFKFVPGEVVPTGINMTSTDKITIVPITGRFKIKGSDGKWILITESVTFPSGGKNGGLMALGVDKGSAKIIRTM